MREEVQCTISGKYFKESRPDSENRVVEAVVFIWMILRIDDAVFKYIWVHLDNQGRLGIE